MLDGRIEGNMNESREPLGQARMGRDHTAASSGLRAGADG